MPTGVVAPFGQRQFCDSNGAPYSGGKLYYYAAGTSTPLDTYSDSALTTPNTNPVTLNSAGRATVYLTPATAYKEVLKDSLLNTIYTQDNITVATPDAAVTQIIAGTGITIAYTGATSGTGNVTVTASTGVPTGSILPYGAAAAPTGYLLCDGTAVSRTTYATLFGVVATLWGVGDGSTTFNVPDLRGKFPLGVATAGTGSTLGGSGGTIDHVHTGPSHTHDAGTLAGPSHTHTITTGTGATYTQDIGNGGVVSGVTLNTSNHTHSGTTAASGTGAVTGATAAGGTGNTGTANPPFAAVQFIIKT